MAEESHHNAEIRKNNWLRNWFLLTKEQKSITLLECGIGWFSGGICPTVHRLLT